MYIYFSYNMKRLNISVSLIYTYILPFLHFIFNSSISHFVVYIHSRNISLSSFITLIFLFCYFFITLNYTQYIFHQNKSDFVTPPLTTFVVSGIFKDVVFKFPPISRPLFSLTVVVLGLYPSQFLGLDYFFIYFLNIFKLPFISAFIL